MNIVYYARNHMSDLEFYFPVIGSFALAIAGALTVWLIFKLLKEWRKKK